MPDIYSMRGGDLSTKDERARRAVKEFRRMQPMLSAYARLITGRKDVRVVMDPRSNGMTDGKRIMFKPPIELGDPTPHVRDLCDKRDEELQQRCRACSIREGVFVTIFHEIGHIAHDSFAQVSDRDKADAIRQAVTYTGKKYSQAMEQRLNSRPGLVTNYQSLTGLVSPFLPFLVNCLEDARINAEVFKARKGTRTMFQADTWRTFNEGIETRDPSGKIVYTKWETMPLNQQAAIGVFCLASGYDPTPWLAPEVAAALHDSELIELCSKVEGSGSAAAVYHLAFPILTRLRELGFMRNPNDPHAEEEDKNDDDSEAEGAPEEAPEQQEGDDADGSGQDGDDSGGASEDASESDSAGSEAGDNGAPGSGEGAGEPSDSATGGGDDSDSEQHDDAGSGSADHDAGDQAEGGGAGSEDGDSEDEAHGASDQRGADSTGGNASGSEPEEGELNDEQADAEAGGGTDEAATEQGPSSVHAGGSSEPADDGEGLGEEGLDDRPGAASDSVDPEGDDGEGVDGDDSVPESSSDADDRGADDLGSESGSPRDGVDDATGDDSDTGDQSGEGVVPEGGADLDSGDPTPAEGSDDEDALPPIDTGADEGFGGIPVTESDSDLPLGEPDDMIGLHEIACPEERPSHIDAERASADAIETAVIQGVYFEMSSVNINGVREHHYDSHCYVNGVDVTKAWRADRGRSARTALGVEGEFVTPESVLGPALLHMRVAFSDNQRGKHLTNRKAGKINTKVLGKRAYHGDERLFKKRILPGKKDYFVLIGCDISGSTSGVNLMLIKKAAFAQAELCHRLGIKFAVYCHTGSYSDGGHRRQSGMDVDIYHIKDADEPWSQKVQQRLLEIGPSMCNLDGHTLEYYRKVLDTRTETDRIILYYTDGKMPAENHDEELEILQREIKICRKKDYTLLGVGIRTDSPTAHGLDTVMVTEESDTLKVIKHLEKRLLAP